MQKLMKLHDESIDKARAEEHDPSALAAHGIALGKKGRFADAILRVARAAELGSSLACHQIGMYYYLGQHGFQKDVVAACTWFKRIPSCPHQDCSHDALETARRILAGLQTPTAETGNTGKRRAVAEAEAEQAKRPRNDKSVIEQLSQELECPISLSLPSDPVMAEDGRIYERSKIEEWINKQGGLSVRSPSTNKPMEITLSQPPQQLLNTIRHLREAASAPSTAAAAPPPKATSTPPKATSTLNVVLPENAKVGDRLSFSTQTAAVFRSFVLTVPPGASAGRKISVSLPIPGHYTHTISKMRLNGELVPA